MRAQRIGVIVLLASLGLSAPDAKAQALYQLDNIKQVNNAGHAHTIFNNSVSSDVEDNWVANSFTVAKNGEELTSISFQTGTAIPGQTVTAALYTGASLTTPDAGGGLVRIVSATNTVNLINTANTFQTIPFSTPVVLPIGQVFYAALLIRGVQSNQFPFTTDNDATSPASSPLVLGRSFFDVGPVQGGAYNLDDTGNATVLGGTHPVVGSGIQPSANLVLRVNALATPEPGTWALMVCLAVSTSAFAARRRKR